jgi:hypothetical protein
MGSGAADLRQENKEWRSLFTADEIVDFPCKSVISFQGISSYP